MSVDPAAHDDPRVGRMARVLVYQGEGEPDFDVDGEGALYVRTDSTKTLYVWQGDEWIEK